MIQFIGKRILRIFEWETQQNVLELYSAIVHPRGKPYFAYWRSQVARNSKYNDPARIIDRLLRYEKIMGNEIPFEGRRVLEIGAGPGLGWVFCALALGAERVYVLEPAFDPSLLVDLSGYLKEHHRYVYRVFGRVSVLEDLLRNGQVNIITNDASHTGLPDGAIDLILSNSVLEHIHNLDDVVKELHRISHPRCVQYHFVDLTDHYKGDDPFSHLYPFHPDYLRRLFARRGLPINLLRASDLGVIFSRYFKVKQTVFFENGSCSSVRQAHNWWKNRYSSDELGIEMLGLEAISI